jgi:D-xylose transport system substrate-binding protein
MAQYVTSKVPSGNYVVIGGSKEDKNAILIKEGNYKVINPLVEKGDIKKTYDVYADWTADEGYHQMKTYLNLSGSVPDVVLSSNDGIAEGVIKALAEAGVGDGVLITGLDADLKACQRIMEGKQTLTIYKPFKEQAYCAVEAAFQMAGGKKPEKTNTKVNNGYKDVDAFLATPTLVDQANIRSVIIENKVYTEAQLQSHP